MRDYIQKDPWNIIEEGFDPALNRISESIFSIGNGKMASAPILKRNTAAVACVAAMLLASTTRQNAGRLVEERLSRIFRQSPNAINWIALTSMLMAKNWIWQRRRSSLSRVS